MLLTCVCVFLCMCTCVYISVCVCLCVYVMCVFICLRGVCVYVRLYVFVNVYSLTYCRKRDNRQTDTQIKLRVIFYLVFVVLWTLFGFYLN